MMQRANRLPKLVPEWLTEPLYMLNSVVNLYLWESPYKRVNCDDPFFFALAGSDIRDRKFISPRDRLLMTGVLLLTVALAVGLYVFNAMSIAVAVVVLSLLASVVVDFVCILYGVNAVRSLRHIMPLMNVTNVKLTALLQARMDTARVLAWRAHLWMVFIRLIGVVMAGAVTAIFSREALQEPLPLFEQTRNVGFYVGIFFTFAVYMLSEPYWRYRVMTALGVYQAARNSEPYRVWTAVFGSVVFGFYVWQAVILVGWQLFFLLSQVFFGMEVAVRYILPVTEYTVTPFVFGLLGGAFPVIYTLLIRHSQSRFIAVQQSEQGAFAFFQQQD